MSKQIEQIETIWKDVFKEKVYTHLDGDDITVGGYIISPKEMMVKRVSILGTQNKTVQGWELIACIETPSSDFSPADVDEVFLGEKERFDEIITLMIENEANIKIRTAIDMYNMTEYQKEQVIARSR